jgi:hypothetical protein
MKLYTTIKTGYTAGIYGCSGEYFTTTIIDTDKEGKLFTDIIHHEGMYGSEQRINSLLEEKGYKYIHTSCSYGKLTRKDIPSKWYMSEYTAIDYIKTKIH